MNPQRLNEKTWPPDLVRERHQGGGRGQCPLLSPILRAGWSSLERRKAWEPSRRASEQESDARNVI